MVKLEQLPWDRICGLRPDVWVCVGSGFAREEVKSFILSQGIGFTGQAVVTPAEICLKILNQSKESILGSTTRQEILRALLSDTRILSRLPEIKRAKRQRNFLRRLDQSFQAGRLSFAHFDEGEVFHERLTQSRGENRVRTELRLLAGAYEAWLESISRVDLPLLFRKACETLRSDWSAEQSFPQEVYFLSVQKPESLEKEFWDLLGQKIQIHTISYSDFNFEESQDVQWLTWHTLDDAAESLAENLVQVSDSWNQHAILIPDIPAVRRSLNRALKSYGLPLADPRDPTRLRWEESLKNALLPLQLVARGFDRSEVISYLRIYQMQLEYPSWVVEINSRGIRKGLSSYAGGMLSGVHSRLKELQDQFGGKLRCEEVAAKHLSFLRDQKLEESESWLIPFLEQTWQQFQDDLILIEENQKRAPLLFWLERLQTRMQEASPPADRFKPSHGIQIYRLQQAPVKPAENLWVFGLPPQWLNGDGTGDFWFSEREREILAVEFSVRSSIQVRQERLGVLKSWISGAKKVSFLDAQYSVEGRERESILPVLKELEVELGFLFPQEFKERGSHSRWTASYRMLRNLQPQKIKLSPLPRRPGEPGPEITATTLDRFSRCSFQALTYHRWKLREIREPDLDLWSEVRGNILHEAVRLLLSDIRENGNLGLSPEQALEEAWKLKRPKGLVQNRRVEDYAKSRLLQILKAFCEKESEYLKKSGARPASLDDFHFRIDRDDFSILGQPDRIDQHSEGVFIMDYKSSGSLPHGSEMVERGYRLQLPFYALAVQKTLKQPVLGLQFIELDKKAGRKAGVFFGDYNGKDPGKLTSVRSSSKSLVNLPPEEVWSLFENQIAEKAEAWISGCFEARPNQPQREKECSRCGVADLCGYRRLVSRGDLAESSIGGSDE